MSSLITNIPRKVISNKHHFTSIFPQKKDIPASQYHPLHLSQTRQQQKCLLRVYHSTYFLRCSKIWKTFMEPTPEHSRICGSPQRLWTLLRPSLFSTAFYSPSAFQDHGSWFSTLLTKKTSPTRCRIWVSTFGKDAPTPAEVGKFYQCGIKAIQKK